jgi:hypothetical protein
LETERVPGEGIQRPKGLPPCNSSKDTSKKEVMERINFRFVDGTKRV